MSATKHDFDVVSKTWQTGSFMEPILNHTIKKMVCKKCGLVVGPDSKDGSRKKCVGDK